MPFPILQGPASLEVSMGVRRDGITEFFELPETVWLRRHRSKVQGDLGREEEGSAGEGGSSFVGGDGVDEDEGAGAVTTPRIVLDGASPSSGEEEAGGGSRGGGTWGRRGERGRGGGGALFAHYIRVVEHLQSKFPRRHFQLLGLDEHNVFRPLTSFVAPVYCGTATLSTPDLVAANVARVHTPARPQGIPSTPPLDRGDQVSSPALVLFRRVGWEGWRVVV